MSFILSSSVPPKNKQAPTQTASAEALRDPAHIISSGRKTLPQASVGNGEDASLLRDEAPEVSETDRDDARSFLSEIRVYPFPPPRRPLIRPLPPLQTAANLLTSSTSDTSSLCHNHFLHSRREEKTMQTSSAPLSSHEHLCPSKTPIDTKKIAEHFSMLNGVHKCERRTRFERFVQNGKASKRVACIKSRLLQSVRTRTETEVLVEDNDCHDDDSKDIDKGDATGCRDAQLHERIHTLVRRRRASELQEIKDIIALATTYFKDAPVTKHERLLLKHDLQRLKRRGTRDVIRLLSYSMGSPNPSSGGIELEFSLDSLPADVIRQLQTLVRREKGDLDIAASRLLADLRTELYEALREYRRIVGRPWCEWEHG